MKPLWQRLRAVLGRPAARPDKSAGDRPPATPAGGAKPTGRSPSSEDDAQRIYHYARRLGPLDARPARCDPAIRAALTRLGQSANQAPAITLGGTLAAALPHDAELQLAVAELLGMQREYRPMGPLLQRVLDAPQASRPQRLRARFLLHEVALAADDAELAMTHLTQLLAEDFGYPGARARLATLQARSRAGQVAATRLGQSGPQWAEPAPAALPGGLTAPAAPTLIGLPGGPEARYQLVRELGCGSSGTVYLARDTELHCELALKVFYPRDGADDAVLLRALHEARLLAAIRHPGVIALYDIAGELPAEPGNVPSGPPRLAMELCRGGSLRARLKAGPLPTRAALLRGTELFSTLVAVHGTGVVHGDLKPENLLFRGPDLHHGDLPPPEALLGDLVLSDFGLARLGAADGAASRGLGTFGYTAPERLTGASTDAASDVYSAAAVLLEMLCGELLAPRAEAPYLRPLLALLPAARWATVIAPLGAAGPALRALLDQLLAVDPAARPTAAAALAELTAITHSLPSELDG